ncbi:MAG: portal protein, partial [Anaerolineales bacterium]
MYSGRADDICREAEGCFGRRGNLLEFWQDTADLHYPERADFTHKKTLGEDFASKLYAGQPALYRRDFGNFLGSALRPKGRKWFDYRCRDQRVDEHSTVRTWLEARTEDTRKLLYDPKSGFVKSSAQADHD